MASTYTDLGIELMTTGENAGTWGTKTNNNLTLIEQLTGGVLSLSIAGGAGTQGLTVTDGDLAGTAQQRVIEFTGSITGNRIITWPVLTENFYIIKNSTSGAYTVQLKAASGSGATVTFSTTEKGYKIIYLDGVATNTGVYDVGIATLTGVETLTNKTLTSPVFSGTATNFTSTGIDDNATSTAITIDSSENVGIGTSSPARKVQVQDTSASVYLAVTSANSNAAGIMLGDTDSEAVGRITYTNADNAMQIWTNGSEAMRIDSSGNVLINTTTAATSQGVMFGNNGQTQIRRGSLGDVIFFINSGSGNVVGKIRINAASTSYTTTSDYRLKGNVSYDFDATTRLKQLKPARFNFIADADTTVDGFIAHEVQSVIPEAISGEKDAVETKEKVVVNANGNVIEENIEQADWEIGKIADEDGNTKYPTDSTWEATKVVPDYQGIDQSKLVPLLVKTIQELEARITALETTTP